ncbi:MAG: NAD(P)/FAD-dependent oxidoreductase [Candidatus Nanopelagicales bacterium]|nr:NAD(P)/FAD-dependent oxidoreductase [Candidatus Nanopelagicales bacterium]
MTDVNVDLAIIGAGPTGLYAAYYSGFRGWSTAVIDALPEVGGQITAMYPEKEISDVAGFPSVRGRVLVEQLKQQADQFNPRYVLGTQATTMTAPESGPVVIESDDGTKVTAKAALITGGIGSFRPRPLPAGDGWEGRGLEFFVPRTDKFAGRDIVIVGGGDSALDWAHMLHPVAKSVAVVHRRDQFRAHGTLVDKARELGMKLMTPYEVTALRGDPNLSEVEITHKKTGDITVLPAQSVIAALGFVANIGPIAQWGLDLEKRHILVDTHMRTNLPNVFAAGDIAVYPGKVPLLAVGFGEAALAVNNAAPIVSPELGVFPGHSSGESN